MNVLTEGSRRNAEFLISEAEHFRAREKVTVAPGADTTLEAGTVLGIITASGKYAIYDPDAVDGTESVAGILYEEAKNADVERTVIVREAQVKADKLAWFDGADAGEIATGTAELLALGIVVR